MENNTIYNIKILMDGVKHTEKSFLYKFLHPWFGTGLLTSHGEKWIKRRRLIAPTFHSEILNDFLQVMNEQADILIMKLESEVKDNSEKEIDIFKKMCYCALDIICGNLSRFFRIF
jgi:cytochrome P450